MRQTEDNEEFDDEGESFDHFEDEVHANNSSDNSESQDGFDQTSSRVTTPERVSYRRSKNANAVHKRTALRDLLATAPPQRIYKQSQPMKKQRLRRSHLSAHLIQELESCVGNVNAEGFARSSENLSDALYALSKSRRKQSNPRSTTSLPARATMKEGFSADAASRSYSLRYWSGFGGREEGGSATRTAHQPWSIQSWLVGGFERKQAIESTTGESQHVYR